MISSQVVYTFCDELAIRGLGRGYSVSPPRFPLWREKVHDCESLFLSLQLPS